MTGAGRTAGIAGGLTRQIRWHPALLVLYIKVRSVIGEKPDYLVRSALRHAVKRRLTVGVERIDVGATIDQYLHRLDGSGFRHGKRGRVGSSSRSAAGGDYERRGVVLLGEDLRRRREEAS